MTIIVVMNIIIINIISVIIALVVVSVSLFLLRPFGSLQKSNKNLRSTKKKEGWVASYIHIYGHVYFVVVRKTHWSPKVVGPRTPEKAFIFNKTGHLKNSRVVRDSGKTLKKTWQTLKKPRWKFIFNKNRTFEKIWCNRKLQRNIENPAKRSKSGQMFKIRPNIQYPGKS